MAADTHTPVVLVGVDAGGSHTAAAVADEALVVLGRATGSAGAVRPGEVAGSAAAVSATVRQAMRGAGIEGPATLLVIGAAGAGRPEERDALRDAVSRVGLAERVEVTTDAAIALESVFHTMPGILVNAGSGSIAYARDPAGVVWRLGGLGWQLGDEGGGYALARAALSAVGKAADGRGPGTALSSAITTAVGATTLGDLIRWAASADRPAVAALARTVAETAQHGDPVARTLVEVAAEELALHVTALLHRFPEHGHVPVAFSGGLLTPGSAVRAALVGVLEAEVPSVEIAQATVDAPLGAVALAARLRG